MIAVLFTSFSGALLGVLFAWGIKILLYKYVIKGNPQLESLPQP